MKKSSSENILVLDIGSGSVGAAVVCRQKNRLPEIVASARVPFFTDTSHQTLQKRMLEAAESAVVKVSKTPRKISASLIVFSSPWLTSQLSTSIIQSKKSVLTSTLIEDVLHQASQQFKSHLDTTYGGTHEVFESAVMNLSGSKLHFSQSAASSTLIRHIENRILKHVHIERGVALQSFLFVFFKILTHAFHDLDSFVVAQFGEEMTDLLFIKNSQPALSISLPFGSTALGAEIAREMKVELPVALSLQRLFAEGALDASLTKKLDRAFSKVENDWSNLWESTTRDFAHLLSEKIFVVSSHPFEGIAKAMFGTLFSKSSVTVIGYDNLFTETIVRTPTEKLFDERLRLEASFSTLL